MAEINDQQRAFVVALVDNGGNATQAAIAAGYSKVSARQQAHALLDKPHVTIALREEQRRALSRMSSQALRVLEGLLNDNKAPHRVRIDAAKIVLDRAGHMPRQEKPEEETSKKSLDQMSSEELYEVIRGGNERLERLAVESG